VKIRKADLHANPYPIDGDFYWVLDAYNMKSNTRDINPSSNNYGAEHLIEAMLNFNGTQTATLRIVDIIDEPAWEYRYSVNLKTGAIARLN
jgi:hypothetical protein